MSDNYARGKDDMKAKRKAQSILEYALIISAVVAALSAMNIYVQRSIQANLKLIENQINVGPSTDAPAETSNTSNASNMASE